MADEIEGPLGLWPFPVLNTIIKVQGGSDSSDKQEGMEITEVNRGSNGRIQSIERVRE
jgi:hypothetical protein